MSDKLYTQEQLDIALIKNTNEGILRTLSEIKTEIKSNFHSMLGLIGLVLRTIDFVIIGFYTIGFAVLLRSACKAYGWF